MSAKLCIIADWQLKDRVCFFLHVYSLNVIAMLTSSGYILCMCICSLKGVWRCGWREGGCLREVTFQTLSLFSSFPIPLYWEWYNCQKMLIWAKALMHNCSVLQVHSNTHSLQGHTDFSVQTHTCRYTNTYPFWWEFDYRIPLQKL